MFLLLEIKLDHLRSYNGNYNFIVVFVVLYGELSVDIGFVKFSKEKNNFYAFSLG